MEHFTNEPVEFQSLPKFETVSLKPLHKDYLNVVYMGNTIFSLIISVIVVMLILFNDWFKEQIWLVFALLLAFILLIFMLSNIAFRKKGYALREKDIIFKRGILATNITVVPLNRIQHVALHEGIFSRMYDLSEVQIYTAGGSGSDLGLPGLLKEDAEKIKTFLLSKIVNESQETIEEVNLVSNQQQENEDTLLTETENQPKIE